jgi:hypothetical protein
MLIEDRSFIADEGDHHALAAGAGQSQIRQAANNYNSFHFPWFSR